MLIFTKIISGESLMLNLVVKDVCARSLSNIILYLCSAPGYPEDDFLLNTQSKTNGAATFSRERYKRNYIDECCFRPCTISELMEYCPEHW